MPSNDLNKTISNLQKIVRKNRSFKKMKELSGIDIERQSQKNILDLYHRLRKGTDLPSSTAERMKQEKKKPQDVLTPSELAFFKKIIQIPLIANHATNNADLILSKTTDARLYSINQLNKHKINVSTHTPDYYGERNFVFFSYGLPNKINAVKFVGPADLLLINLDQLAAKDPQLFSGAWSSGHFFAYDGEQVSDPVVYTINGVSTQVFNRYELTTNPLLEYQKHFVFQSQDGTSQLTLTRESEISLGRHIKPYHLLRLIEFIRFLDPKIRQSILENPEDPSIAELFDSLFTPGKAELHFPEAVQLPIKEDPNTFSLERKKETTQEDKEKLIDCILANNYKKLSDYINQKKSLNLYEYSDEEKMNYSLLHLAVLEQRYDMVTLLLNAGIDTNKTYGNKKNEWILNHPPKHALQDAIEMHDTRMINILCGTSSPADKQRGIVYCSKVMDIDMYTAIAVNLDMESFKFLLKQYQLAHTNINNLLALAVYYNNLPALKLLLEAKANSNASIQIRREGENAHIIPFSLEGTALSIAARHGRQECAALLLKHAAGVNAFPQWYGDTYKYGRGDSSLISAMKGLANKPQPGIMNSRSAECIKINNPRYESLPQPKKEDFHAIIRLLLDQGANSLFINGHDESFVNLAKRHLLKKEDSFLKTLIESIEGAQSISPKAKVHAKEADKVFKHESYAFITRFNSQKKQEELLIGTIKKKEEKEFLSMEIKQEAENGNLDIPGGLANYQQDKDLSETVVNLSAYELGIDLSKEAKESDKPQRFANADESIVLQMQHYQLQEQQQPVYQNTLDALGFSVKRGDHPKALKNIQFIALADIQIELISYKGIEFPLCTYQGRMLPYITAIKIANLRGIELKNIQETQELALKLHMGQFEFIKAIKEGDVRAIQSLIQLKVYNKSDLLDPLELALKSGQFEIAKILLSVGAKLKDINTMIHVYQHVEFLQPEELTLILLEAHPEFKENKNYYPSLLDIVGFYAGRHGHLQLAKRLIAEDKNLAQEIINSGVLHAQPAIVKMLLAQLPVSERDEFIKNSLEAFYTRSSRISNDENFLEMIDFFISQYQGTALNAKGVKLDFENLRHIFGNILAKNSDVTVQKHCFQLIDQLINGKFMDSASVFYWVHFDLQYIHKCPKQAADLVTIIKNNPEVEILLAGQKRDYESLYTLLEKNHQDPCVRKSVKYLRVPSDFLQKAVKSNNLSMVQLLLENCLKKKKFDIEIADSEGLSPLENALKLGFIDIAKEFKKHAADMKKDIKGLASVPSSPDIRNHTSYCAHYSNNGLFGSIPQKDDIAPKLGQEEKHLNSVLE